MDVLDHSCSKLGFGGKMCIDGTKKFEEETVEENLSMDHGPRTMDVTDLMKRFREIKHVNTNLLSLNIPCIIVSVKKERKGHVKELHAKLASLNEIEGVKMIVYVEDTVNANDLSVALWRFCNNLDPKRDQF